MPRCYVYILTLFVALSVCGCSNPPGGRQSSANRQDIAAAQAALQARDIAAIAKDVSSGVGDVRSVEPGGSGCPVIVLEERHESRAGQIEHAIMLHRLCSRYSLKDIALEGYLKESPAINTDWFDEAVGSDKPEDRAQVAVNLLREGEIGASEFTRLVHSGVALHPAEFRKDHDVELAPDAAAGALAYVNAIGAVDGEWAREAGKPFRSIKSYLALTTTQHLAIARKLTNRAKELNVAVNQADKARMAAYTEFLQARSEASATMVDTCLSASKDPSCALIALNCGAMHADDLCAELRKAGRPYAVIRPLALKNKDTRGDLSPDQLLVRKWRKQSIFSSGVMSGALRLASGSTRKPEPVLDEPFFKAKAEFYGNVDKLNRKLLELAPSSAGGGPPYGFSDDEFRGRYVYIDPRQVTVISDPDDKHRKRIVFPVCLTGDNGRSTTLWVKSSLARDMDGGSGGKQETHDTVTIECMLRSALDQVRSEKRAPVSSEDTSCAFRPSTRTVAVVSTDKATVSQMSMSLAGSM